MSTDFKKLLLKLDHNSDKEKYEFKKKKRSIIDNINQDLWQIEKSCLPSRCFAKNTQSKDAQIKGARQSEQRNKYHDPKKLPSPSANTQRTIDKMLKTLDMIKQHSKQKENSLHRKNSMVVAQTNDCTNLSSLSETSQRMSSLSEEMYQPFQNNKSIQKVASIGSEFYQPALSRTLQQSSKTKSYSIPSVIVRHSESIPMEFNTNVNNQKPGHLVQILQKQKKINEKLKATEKMLSDRVVKVVTQNDTLLKQKILNEFDNNKYYWEKMFPAKLYSTTKMLDSKDTLYVVKDVKLTENNKRQQQRSLRSVDPKKVTQKEVSDYIDDGCFTQAETMFPIPSLTDIQVLPTSEKCDDCKTIDMSCSCVIDKSMTDQSTTTSTDVTDACTEFVVGCDSETKSPCKLSMLTPPTAFLDTKHKPEINSLMEPMTTHPATSIRHRNDIVIYNNVNYHEELLDQQLTDSDKEIQHLMEVCQVNRDVEKLSQSTNVVTQQQKQHQCQPSRYAKFNEAKLYKVSAMRMDESSNYSNSQKDIRSKPPIHPRRATISSNRLRNLEVDFLNQSDNPSPISKQPMKVRRRRDSSRQTQRSYDSFTQYSISEPSNVDSDTLYNGCVGKLSAPIAHFPGYTFQQKNANNAEIGKEGYIKNGEKNRRDVKSRDYEKKVEGYNTACPMYMYDSRARINKERETMAAAAQLGNCTIPDNIRQCNVPVDMRLINNGDYKRRRAPFILREKPISHVPTPVLTAAHSSVNQEGMINTNHRLHVTPHQANTSCPQSSCCYNSLPTTRQCTAAPCPRQQSSQCCNVHCSCATPQIKEQQQSCCSPTTNHLPHCCYKQ